MSAGICRVVAAAAVVLAAAAARAQPARQPVPLLDVPYVAQGVDLCGGAAAAMVMRFWGRTGVYAEDFADLVDSQAGGIRGDDLLQALRTRGWEAHAAAGDAALVKQQLERGRPPIVLIEDRPGRFHYVVVVGWHTERVVLHDPARAPFRRFDERRFMEAWSRSGHWMLLALPGTEDGDARRSTRLEEPSGSPPATAACSGLVGDAVNLANAGALAEAREVLQKAAATCPGDAAPWRELAGLHAIQKDWKAAAADAARALDRDDADAHAIRILATSLFLDGDRGGALRAWNRIGEPSIDYVDIRGLERTRFSVAAEALDLHPQAPLTPASLLRAGRRLDALPAVLAARVSYAPLGNGLAQVSAAVVERPRLPTSRLHVAGTAVRAAVDRELRVPLASPTGGGELWHVGWRWWEARPGVSLGVAAPSPFGGTWRLEASAEREAYGAADGEFSHPRRRLELAAGDWASAAFRWAGGIALERWETGIAAGAVGSVDVRLDADRARVHAGGGVWSGAAPTWRVDAAVDWQSRSTQQGTVWLSRVGWSGAGPGAPLAIWPGAGTGQGRPELLRAHPLLEDGVVREAVFGRMLAHASVEWRRWNTPGGRLLRLGPAAFLDVARAYHVPAFGDPHTHADIGAGIRIAFPGLGVLRADLAYGLRDGESAVSFGWTR